MAGRDSDFRLRFANSITVDIRYQDVIENNQNWINGRALVELAPEEFSTDKLFIYGSDHFLNI